MVRWSASWLTMMLVAGTVCAADDVEQAMTEARVTVEAQFLALDSNEDGLLDETEFSLISADDVEALQNQGLEAMFPISREAYVTAGMAVAMAVQMPDGDDATRDAEKTDKVDPKTAPTASSTAPVASATVVVQRSGVKKSHFVPELPAEYAARDKNGDGQIALYEWDRKKYAEFHKLDRNGDGFLTPAELLPKGAMKTLYERTAARPATGGTPGAAPSGSSTASAEDPIEREARSSFSQMDENKDGAIDENDWSRSRRIRPWFEGAGIKVSLPMQADAFVAHYRKARESSGR